MQNETNTSLILDLSVNLAIAVIHARGPLPMGTSTDLKALMRSAYEAVAEAATPVVVTPAVPDLYPAVPIKKSVTPDFIICLEDGKKFKSLKRHIMTHFKLTPDEYRAKWGLPADYPMVAPNYAAIRSKLAKDNGLGKKAA